MLTAGAGGHLPGMLYSSRSALVLVLTVLCASACAASSAGDVERNGAPAQSPDTDTLSLPQDGGALLSEPSSSAPASSVVGGETEPVLPTAEAGVPPAEEWWPLAAACPIETLAMRQLVDREAPEPERHCVEMGTSGLLPREAYSETDTDAKWQSQGLLYATAFEAEGGPWQFERLAGTDVLARNAQGKQALLSYLTYSGVCYFEQAFELGYEVRDVHDFVALACKGRQCVLAHMPAAGVLDLEAPLAVFPDEGWQRLFQDAEYDLSLANDERVVHWCGGYKDGPPDARWRFDYTQSAEATLKDYLPAVSERCGDVERWFLQAEVGQPTPRTFFGERQGEAFIFTDLLPGLPKDETLPEPRCDALQTELTLLDAGVINAFTGPHTGVTLTQLLTATEMRGHVRGHSFR